VTELTPHFVYGTLRPGELAHHQLSAHISRIEPATLGGYRLYVRDGLPFITAEEGHSVQGELLHPADAMLADKISAYEGTKLYYPQLAEVGVVDGRASAVVYIGRSPTKGNAAPVDRPWSSAGDPLITDGLRVLGCLGAEHFADPRRGPVPADMTGFWDRFIPLQGLYLSLASVLERYTALTVGPNVEPTARVVGMDADPDAQAAVRQAKPPPITVVRSDNLQKTLRAPGSKSWQAWYAVRSNLSHRGKSALTDFKLLERAIVGLHDALRIVVASKLTDLVPAVNRDELLRPVYDRNRG
jgi:gamma-glutamylcyclotransferase (GGCT)/AIG2-like uncharacterized protein YtfP